MDKNDVCEIYQVDAEKVKKVKPFIEEDFQKVAELFKALADETRLKIMYILCQEERLCVCEIAETVGVSTQTASHHLRLLKNVGLAKYEKEGKLVYYSLEDEHVKEMVLNGIAHSKER